MNKLVLSGAVALALMAGPAVAADLAARPRDRAVPAVDARQRHQPRGLCWEDGLFGAWRPCPQPCRQAATRPARRSAAVITSERPAEPFAPVCRFGAPRNHYWATSLSGPVNRGLLQGLQEAAARGEIGWLDIDARFPVSGVAAGVNLILYHVGGNCYAGGDCARFPASQPLGDGDRWGSEERKLDLNDPQVRKIVVGDLVNVARQADALAPKGASVGVHLDNVHRLDAEGLARLINEYLQAVDTAKHEGLIAKERAVGYVAKNNADGFRKALDQKLLRVPPLYQINENATLDAQGALDPASRAALEFGRRYGIPVFLKTFGSDVAYTVERDGNRVEVKVTPDMARRMAQLGGVAGVAWSADETRYQPTLFAPGAPVRPRICEPAAAGAAPALSPPRPTATAAAARPARDR
jgi:hypothetical protein